MSETGEWGSWGTGEELLREAMVQANRFRTMSRSPLSTFPPRANSPEQVPAEDRSDVANDEAVVNGEDARCDAMTPEQREAYYVAPSRWTRLVRA
jgi:hypothetical protein